MRVKIFSKGFSLVEIMITIAIIALIAAASLGSISSIQRTSRDTQRTADLNSIKSALQQYFANENHYPDSMTLTAGAALDNCTGLATPPCVVNRTYLKSTPKDPVGSVAYCYLALSNADPATTTCTTAGQCYYYKLFAKLENTTGTLSCGAVSTYSLQLTPL